MDRAGTHIVTYWSAWSRSWARREYTTHKAAAEAAARAKAQTRLGVCQVRIDGKEA